jgi:hypothetical protein
MKLEEFRIGDRVFFKHGDRVFEASIGVIIHGPKPDDTRYILNELSGEFLVENLHRSIDEALGRIFSEP